MKPYTETTMMRNGSIADLMPQIVESIGENIDIIIKVNMNEYGKATAKIVNCDERRFSHNNLGDIIPFLFDLDIHGWSVVNATNLVLNDKSRGVIDLYMYRLV